MNNHHARQHNWTFMSAQSNFGRPKQVCPCIRPNEVYPEGIIPPFVGQDYFCDTTALLDVLPSDVIYADTSLWESAGCEGTSACCEVLYSLVGLS